MAQITSARRMLTLSFQRVDGHPVGVLIDQIAVDLFSALEGEGDVPRVFDAAAPRPAGSGRGPSHRVRLPARLRAAV